VVEHGYDEGRTCQLPVNFTFNSGSLARPVKYFSLLKHKSMRSSSGNQLKDRDIRGLFVFLYAIRLDAVHDLLVDILPQHISRVENRRGRRKHTLLRPINFECCITCVSPSAFACGSPWRSDWGTGQRRGRTRCGGHTERSEEPFAGGGSRRVSEVEKGRRWAGRRARARRGAVARDCLREAMVGG
jgi:hypothetical protein